MRARPHPSALAVFRVALALWLAAAPVAARAGMYLQSAHGSSTYGVLRASMARYCRGHCGHCHEQHASVNDQEPDPPGGPDVYLLFDEGFRDQKHDLCYACHVESGGYQSGGVVNHNYAYTFGGYTQSGSYDTDIDSAFSHTKNKGSSHYLEDMVGQVLGRTMYDADNNAWSLPADISPCAACHNPHLARRNSPVSVSGGALNSAVSRPSDHDNLWGDEAGERMSDAGTYQAPYWYGRTDRYEPANDAVQDGSNLPDYTRLCTDCHNPNNTIYSTNPRLPDTPRNLAAIDWGSSGDAHGGLDGTPSRLLQPFASASGNLVLSCLDCHEPHGATTNVYLLRTSVNAKAVSVTDESNTSWLAACQGTCHNPSHTNRNNCANCHRHGGDF